MSKDAFAQRLQRISNQSPDAHIAIPGQVGEPNRKLNKSKQQHEGFGRRRKESALTSLLFGGICGAVAGLAFQQVVGIETLLNFDWQTELALMEADRIRAAVWGVIAAGATMMLMTLPSRKRFRKLAGGSLAYMGTAIGVNAQELLALVPAGV